jgi:hypothetical protein
VSPCTFATSSHMINLSLSCCTMIGDVNSDGFFVIEKS